MKKTLIALIILSIGFLTLSSSPAKAQQGNAAGPVGSNGLRAYPGPGVGQVTLEWSRVSLSGENYSIHYGTSSKNYPFLADHVGYLATYTVNNLTPGQVYYFVLERFWTGNASQGWDGEVSVTAPGFASSPEVTAGPIGRNLLTASTLGNGQVKLSWNQYFSDTNGWHIVYGTIPGRWQWGVLNAVNAVPGITSYSFDIGLLPVGQRVYFALSPVRGGQAQYITAEVSVVVQ